MSTDAALSMMVGRLQKALRTKKGAAIALFLDIRGAFDNVNVRDLHANDRRVNWGLPRSRKSTEGRTRKKKHNKDNCINDNN